MDDVFWIQGEPRVPLAIVLCPGFGAALRAALQGYKRDGVQTVVSLLSGDQVAMLGLEQEGAVAEELGMNFLWFPLPDHGTPPNLRSFRAFVSEIADRLQAGERIGVHCWGSVGRAPITAACALMHLGWQPAQALEAITEARGLAVPDTQEQHDWILRYTPKP